MSFRLLAVLVAALDLGAATVTVRATHDGVTDDTSAVQTSIDSSQSGDTVWFPAGVYRLSHELLFRSDRSYIGAPGANAAILRQTTPAMFVGRTEFNSTRNLVIDSLTFEGAGLMLDGVNVPANGVRITRSTFRNITQSPTVSWVLRSGIFCGSGMAASQIDHNRFENIWAGTADPTPTDQDATAVRLYRLSQTSVSDNEFTNVNQAISIQFDGTGPYPGVVLAHNTGTGLHRMGIELQGSHTVDLLIEGNTFSAYRVPYPNTFGISAVVDGGTGTVVRDNVMIASPEAATGSRYGFGIEIGGSGSVVSGNTVQGHFWYGISLGTAPGVTVTSNYLCGNPDTTRIAWEQSGYSGTITANETEATCSRPGLN